MRQAEFIDYYDTLDISRRFYPNLYNHKLETLSNLFETEVKSSHNAMDDVLATKDILINIVEEKIRTSSIERKNLCSTYLKKFSSISNDINNLRKDLKINSNGNNNLSSESIISQLRPYELIEKIVSISNIKEVYKAELRRINYVRELYLIAKELDDIILSPKGALMEFLKTTALSNSEIDRMLKKHPRIPIITIHQAKGGEFDYVFLAGLQDYIFPTYNSIKHEDLEEEKRVFYVAMTRAKKALFLTYSRENGKKESRLIQYIPEEYLKRV
ncbi:ATP-dependent DNA helicase UvrD/PcrA [Clostridium tetanomorphum]|nr:ATP-dependent DNA helicase UvrD/PcrA [Clostridium tetanomorphum]